VIARVQCETCGEQIAFARVPIFGTVQERCGCGVRLMMARAAASVPYAEKRALVASFRTEMRICLACRLPFEILTRRKALMCSDVCRMQRKHDIRKRWPSRRPAMRPIFVGSP
jgi:hypothetical protein